MRTPDEIQKAHDVLFHVCSGEIQLGYCLEDLERIRCVLDVLCWVLEHEHRNDFAENLKILLEMMERQGVKVQRLPMVGLPQCDHGDFLGEG